MKDWHRFENTETLTLISYYQNTSNNVDVRNDAFLALVFRFREDLVMKCEIICKNRGYDIDIAKLIAENTFKKYGISANFKIEECSSPENPDNCFLFYLYRIANNELINYYYREEKRGKGLLYNGDESIITKLPDIDTTSLDIENKIIHDTLLSLPYSQRVVYLTYMTHERQGVKLPRKLLSALRDHLGSIDQITVRGYKKLAVDKIENAKKIISELKND